MRIDACKRSTLKLSHVSKFEPKIALVADLLVFEDRHFTGTTRESPLLFVSSSTEVATAREFIATPKGHDGGRVFNSGPALP